MEQVILVDKNDQEIGIEEKLKAHKDGKLHRAFSIFVFNSKNEFMLQKRAADKYHCGGLWTNTCCSHPRPGEKLEDAIHRRLVEEMGFDCDLEKLFHMTYKAHFKNGLTEHEFDHVFVGRSENIPKINIAEVEEWKFVASEDLLKDILANKGKYTAWFKKISPEIVDEYLKN